MFIGVEADAAVVGFISGGLAGVVVAAVLTFAADGGAVLLRVRHVLRLPVFPRLGSLELLFGFLSIFGFTGEVFLILGGDPIFPIGVGERAAMIAFLFGCLVEESFFGGLDVLLVLHDGLNIVVDLAHEFGLFCNALFVGLGIDFGLFDDCGFVTAVKPACVTDVTLHVAVSFNKDGDTIFVKLLAYSLCEGFPCRRITLWVPEEGLGGAE
jgi:hypothetical protein